MLMARYDLLSKKEYHDKMEQLKEKCKEIDAAIASSKDSDQILDGKTALSAEELIGVEKRRAMTLAEQAFAKSKEDLIREQKEAHDFIHKINEERAELDRRKKEYREKMELKHKLEDQKKLEEEEEKKKLDKEKRKLEKQLRREKLFEFKKIPIAEPSKEEKKAIKKETDEKVKEILSKVEERKAKDEERDKAEFQSALERVKEELHKKRSMNPMDHRHFEEHKQKYIQVKEEKEKKLAEERERQLLEIQDQSRILEEIKNKYKLANREAALQRFLEEQAK